MVHGRDNLSQKCGMSTPASMEVRIFRLGAETARQAVTHLAREAALELVVNGRPHSLLMQTPGNEQALTIGYLFTEGLIESPDEIAALEFTEGQQFLDFGSRRVQVRLPKLTDELPARPTMALSSCGLCGKESLERLGHGLSRVKSKQSFDRQVLANLLFELQHHQPLYNETHGVHAAAIFQADGTLSCCYEDVGRHNALDKVIGHGLLADWSFDDKIVVLSGRASLEVIVKTARAGIPLFLCFSSPTVLAVEAAKALNLTLVGRMKDRSLACYTHARRIRGALDTPR